VPMSCASGGDTACADGRQPALSACAACQKSCVRCARDRRIALSPCCIPSVQCTVGSGTPDGGCARRDLNVNSST
jgi:hypothetical protein